MGRGCIFDYREESDNVTQGRTFFNLYNHNFARLAAAIPRVRVADCAFNAGETIALMAEAARRKAILVAFPELGLTGYSCDDLFHQQALLDGCRDGLGTILEASASIPVITVVGLPLVVNDLLFNCAAVLYGGKLLGIAPKTYLPNYREYYEMRYFAPADYAVCTRIDLLGQDVPFGNRLLFEVTGQPAFRFFIEVCEDLWVPIPPSSYASLAGSTVLINLSGSNITVGKAGYRRQLVANQSARCIAAYLYTSAGFGESTTDLAWDGQGLIYENGTRLAESRRFSYDPQLITGDVDLDRLFQDRMRQNSFGQSILRHRDHLLDFRTVAVDAAIPRQEVLLLDRVYERFPFVPSDVEGQDRRCREVYEIQVQGLAKRLKFTGTDKVVIGVSGGLDSTQALIVAVRAMDIMNLPRTNILGCLLPGFATSQRTMGQAKRLLDALGCTREEIDIRPSCMQMFKDIGHPFARGEAVYDIAFENVQAGERTSHLFRLANRRQGLVVGTSDLSELALGWSTYGVGDQMAHYHVNASVPKTLIQYLIRWVAGKDFFGPEASGALMDVLDTVISPELVPGTTGEEPDQQSEDVLGPFALQDFTLYYILRFGFPPPKVAFLSWTAWHERGSGLWPDIPEEKRSAYGIGEIKRWLAVFIERFFQLSQYKRSCIANGPKVGSGGSLSPRADWRAPSDAEAAAWRVLLARIPDEDPG
ncbi:MAG: NAD(+) synthase [Syntrophorhabdales bacterium]|jgi:NAD+ synthase (glutamine-hydrolysing)